MPLIKAVDLSFQIVPIVEKMGGTAFVTQLFVGLPSNSRLKYTSLACLAEPFQ